MIAWSLRERVSIDVKIREDVSNRLSFTIFLCTVAGCSDKHKPFQALWRLDALGGEWLEQGSLIPVFQDLSGHKGSCELNAFEMRTGCYSPLSKITSFPSYPVRGAVHFFLSINHT